MKIYTKTGDQGETAIGGGRRLPKDDLRIAACGEVDELNAALGMCKVECGDDLIADILARIQRDLWVIGADLTAPEVVQIGGKNVSYDVCCDNRETYRWQEENTGWRYLGKGVANAVANVNGVIAESLFGWDASVITRLTPHLHKTS